MLSNLKEGQKVVGKVAACFSNIRGIFSTNCAPHLSLFRTVHLIIHRIVDLSQPSPFSCQVYPGFRLRCEHGHVKFLSLKPQFSSMLALQLGRRHRAQLYSQHLSQPRYHTGSGPFVHLIGGQACLWLYLDRLSLFPNMANSQPWSPASLMLRMVWDIIASDVVMFIATQKWSSG